MVGVVSISPPFSPLLSSSAASHSLSSSSSPPRRPLVVTRSSPNCTPSPPQNLNPPPPTTTIPTAADSDSSTRHSSDDDLDGGRIPGVHVPRLKHIPVSKSELLHAIVSNFFLHDSPQEIDRFLHLSACLDSILHAEHKSILEEIRGYFDLARPIESMSIDGDNSSRTKGKSMPEEDNGSVKTFLDDRIDFEKVMSSDFIVDPRSVGSFQENDSRRSLSDPSNAAIRFQNALIQLLINAEFEELSARDLLLTSALNTDYLLTLPISVDWKKASDSKAIIFRRGYTTERQKGLLLVEKLDYLQSKLVQGIFLSIAKPLEKVGIWLIEALRTGKNGDEQIWSKIKLWLNTLPLFQQSDFYDEYVRDNMAGDNSTSSGDLPVWVAAQRAVARYEGMLSAAGPRGRLLRKLFAWIGLLPSTPKQTLELDSDSISSELYMRPIFLPRIALSDLWTPASQKYCGNDFWKMLKTAFGILFSQSVLQEPAFQELLLLYAKQMDEHVIGQEVEVPPMQLKIYEKIPIPDLPVVFPHKKLSFRILDTVRLDTATVLGLLAYFINYKFEDILSSPSAIPLDVIGVSALVIYVTRVVLGYKQTWDRYQLLVNRTLYEKTVASGFGSVHFLIDASEQQQFKEAILAYIILLKVENCQMSYLRSVGEKCEKFIYTVFKKKVKMPIEKAKNTLVRLGIVTEKAANGKMILQAIPCARASEILEERWASLLG